MGAELTDDVAAHEACSVGYQDLPNLSAKFGLRPPDIWNVGAWFGLCGPDRHRHDRMVHTWEPLEPMTRAPETASPSLTARPTLFRGPVPNGMNANRGGGGASGMNRAGLTRTGSVQKRGDADASTHGAIITRQSGQLKNHRSAGGSPRASE